jgi:outer membrane murein-binding lipoprotein Lpp
MDFQPIFDYIDQSSERLQESLDAKFNSLTGDIANLASEVRTMREETTIANHRLKRLENWAEPVGNKVGIPIKL